MTATDIAKALQAQGFNINPDDINLPGRLDEIEKYTVQVKFAEDLATDIKVWVAPDPESKALIEAAGKAQESRRSRGCGAGSLIAGRGAAFARLDGG